MNGLEDLWKDSCDVYRPAASDENGDPTGWTIVSSRNPCFFHGTPNYDKLQGSVRLKEDGVQTADKVSCGIDVDIRSGDRLKVTLSTGGVEWLQVQGAAKIRTLIPKRSFFVITDRPLSEEEIV